MSYQVELEVFNGPMDLLLYLISKQEVNIHEISIANIVDQYMAYLEKMKALNVDISSDFIVMASTLMLIKSKAMLPTEEVDIEEEIDQQELRSVFEEEIAKIRGLAKQMLASRGLFLISVMQSGESKPPSVPENVTQLEALVRKLESACRAVKGTLSLQREQLGAPVVRIDSFSSSELKIPLKSQLEQLDRLAEASSESVRKII